VLANKKFIEKAQEFILVQGTPKQVTEYNLDESVKKCGMLIIDSYENELAKGSFYTENEIDSAIQIMDKALEADKALASDIPKIAWLDSIEKGVENAKGDKKLLFIAFADDQKDSTKTMEALDQRALLSTNKKFVFVRLKLVKKANKPQNPEETEEDKQKREAEESAALEQMKKWGVSSAPTIFMVDPDETSLEKNPLQKMSGLKDTDSLKKSMRKAQEDYKKIKDERRRKEALLKGPYFCPMHPDVFSKKPGKCPECGMPLEKAK